MKKFSLSVCDFALPAPRRGSIDVHSGLGRGPQIGTEIHQRVQAARTLQHSQYKSEVFISHTFEAAGYSFEVSGRMDGLFEAEASKIEEIKSNFNIYELFRYLVDSQGEHPYCLQLRTYGYFYWLKNQTIPDLSLHLVSTRNGESMDFEVNLQLANYEKWLAVRLQELVEEAQRVEKMIKRRKKAAKNLKFPFANPRPGQVELIQTIEQGLKEDQPLMIQAPTGLGKTMGVLFPSLKEALNRGQKVIYITPKNSQHGVAEDAVERLQEAGAAVKAMTITAKSKMCFKNEPLCNPEYCEYAKDHYTKVAENKVLEQLSKKRRLSAKTFRNVAEAYQVCPFEIQLDAAAEMDTVICDYNYVFAPRTSFGRLTGSGLQPQGKPNLVIDEAHNLPARALDYYSPSLSSAVLENMQEDIRKLPRAFRADGEMLLKSCLLVIKNCRPKEARGPCQISPPVEKFLEQDQLLRNFLSTYLNSDVEIEANDVVMRLCFYWSEFTQALEWIHQDRPEFFTTFHPVPAMVKITCCDASEMLKASYQDYDQVVAFSATLKPFQYYRQLMGLHQSELKTAEFVSPFPKAHRKLLIIPQISSKYSERDKNYPRIAEAISKISAIKPGNYFVFFPSFDFLEKVLRIFSPPPGTQVLKQTRSMKRDQIQDVLTALSDPLRQHIIFAVQGGVFSEGIDYPGSMAIGAFVVGPPLPNFDLEREKMREYYEKYYGAGFDYAYTFPAMAKAVQAAGRVIRSETDQGIIVLMDNRFMQNSFSKSMPQDWFEESPREMVSERIFSDISDFWSGL